MDPLAKAKHAILSQLHGGEQTEDYIRYDCDLRGISDKVREKAIGQLLDDGKILPTMIQDDSVHGRRRFVAALRLADKPSDVALLQGLRGKKKPRLIRSLAELEEHLSVTVTTKKASKASVAAAKDEYRRLVAQQRALPPSEQWTLGKRIRATKAIALAEIEALKFGM